MSEMIDRVARALRNNKASLSNPEAESLARAAISAMREPTTVMINCESLPYCPGEMIEFWQTMIDAALNERSPAAVRPPG